MFKDEDVDMDLGGAIGEVRMYGDGSGSSAGPGASIVVEVTARLGTVGTRCYKLRF